MKVSREGRHRRSTLPKPTGGVAVQFKQLAVRVLQENRARFKERSFVEGALHTLYGTVSFTIHRDRVEMRLLDFPEDVEGDWFWFKHWKYAFQASNHIAQWSQGWQDTLQDALRDHIQLLFREHSDGVPAKLRTPPLSCTSVMWMHADHVPDNPNLGNVRHFRKDGALFVFVEDLSAVPLSPLPHWLRYIWTTARNHACVMIIFDDKAPQDPRFDVYEEVSR